MRTIARDLLDRKTWTDSQVELVDHVLRSSFLPCEPDDRRYALSVLVADSDRREAAGRGPRASYRHWRELAEDVLICGECGAAWPVFVFDRCFDCSPETVAERGAW